MRSKALGWAPIVVLLAACRGQFEAVPELTASPEAIDFGEHQEDRHEPRAETVRFVNTGLVPLNVTSVTIEGEASRALFVENAQALLQPGEVLPIEVRFGTASLPEDFYAADLVVSGDAVPIDAQGCQPGVEPTEETFEEVVSLTFSVRNRCDEDGDGFISVECDGADCDDSDPEINPDAAERCNRIDDNCDGVLPDVETDDDLDGQSECELDCNDADPTVFTGAVEICNGIDDDCDGQLPPLELDVDGDGFRACDDCDDSDAEVFPGAAERCDGQDNNCDGFIPFIESDFDGDGFPVCLGDCDDSDLSVAPGLPEICDGRDNDCDGVVDEGTGDDADGDGFALCDGDCDDTDPQNFPGNVELCDGQDNDCDGFFGEEELDLDGDGVRTCEGDCDDGDPGVFPGNTEICDGRDNDCDDAIDEGFDADGDGFSVCNGDCDDEQATVFPGAPEQCNGEDDDCDGVVPANEIDNDGDGFDTCQCVGLFASPECDCNDANPEVFPGAPEQCNGINDSCSPDGVRGESDDDGDGFRACEECDDDSALRFPGNAEVCDGIDNDCDLIIPENETTDADGDGFVVCLECDDADPAVNPDATEIPCDGIDNNCDGIEPSEEGEDLDGDGAEACEDCDDGNANVFPGAPEQCNGEDDDCDGDIDEGVDVDADGDGVSACAGDCDDTNPDVFPGAVELCNFIDDNCNSAFDEPFRTGSKYTDEAHCGTCNNDCAVAEFDNASGFCETSPAFPFCDYVCDTGFFDVNGLADDGCECEFISAIDEPFDGIDANCDGEDGDPDQAVFVSSIFGNAGASGTIDDPVRDIQEGVDLANALGLRFVNVAIGSYNAFDVRDGINVSGGYDLLFSTRDPVVNRSSLRGVGPMVRAVGISSETVVDGLDIEANGSSTAASIGVWIEDSAGLVFSRNTVFADTGFNGSPGGDGAFGSDGAQGEDGAEGGTTTCASLPLGGAGGFNTCGGFETSGGNGADMNCPVGFFLQPTGQGGRPAFAGGSAGTGSCDSVLALNDEIPPDCTCFIDPSCWDGGQDGGNGASGADGNGGSGGNAPVGIFQPLAAGGWSPSGGGSGGDGDLGGGGGGGGSGSGVEATNCSQDGIGGTGGGGGAGGCGGQRGLGGTGGGASIGIVVFDHGALFPELNGNTVASSNGGLGGAGGDGGQGGAGGFGGEGGEADREASFCTEDGGDGGNGGDGGTGGGGGGGAGGPSFAIYVDAPIDAPRYDDQNVLSHGSGGLGGQRGNGGDTSGSDGTSGTNGADGVLNY